MDVNPNPAPIDVSARVLDTPYGTAQWVPLPTFVDVFLPPMPPLVDLDKLIRKIKRVRAPSNQILTKNDHLWGYSQKRPSDFARGDAYKYLYTCAERLARVAVKSAPRYKLIHNNENLWYLNERTPDSLPDAYVCRSSHDSDATWESIAVSGAYAMRPENIWQASRQRTSRNLSDSEARRI